MWQNILLLLIIVSLQAKQLKRKLHKKELVDKSIIYGFIDNFKTIKDRKIATLSAKTELKAEQVKVM